MKWRLVLLCVLGCGSLTRAQDLTQPLVFHEAISPGWLVFYRYYQGGILTLLGTDGQHYRAAAGPAFQWQPGHWHHLAGTWRTTRLEVFVDGQRVGVLENPVLPTQLAESFVVGDRPWHVPRQRQTLNAE